MASPTRKTAAELPAGAVLITEEAPPVGGRRVVVKRIAITAEAAQRQRDTIARILARAGAAVTARSGRPRGHAVMARAKVTLSQYQGRGVWLAAQDVAGWSIDLSRPVDHRPPLTFTELDYIAWLFMRMNSGTSMTTRWNCTRGDIRRQWRRIARAEWLAWARDEKANRKKHDEVRLNGRGKAARNGASGARRAGK